MNIEVCEVLTKPNLHWLQFKRGLTTHSNKPYIKRINILFVINLEGILNFKFENLSLNIGDSIGESNYTNWI
jgi:hypothetical protein